MGFEKAVAARLFGVTSQGAASAEDLRFTVGDSSGGTFTRRSHPLRGTLFWDRCMYVLQNVAVAEGATGGSYTVTIETDAISGNTGLPIARVTLGPNSPTTAIMDSLHQSAASPLPTHMFIDQTAAGGALTLTCDVIAKQYRGVYGGGANTAERILQGTLLRGTSSRGIFADDKGFEADETFTFGTSGINSLGMHRLRLWDQAMFWVTAGAAVDGTVDVDIVATVGGNTVSIASTGVGGALTTAGQKLALANNFYGQCPNPTQIIWTEVTGTNGVSDPAIVVLAKGGRGSMAKR